MREYIKPSVQIVDIKSSEDIAALTYDEIAKQLTSGNGQIVDYGTGNNQKVARYLVSARALSEVNGISEG